VANDISARPNATHRVDVVDSRYFPNPKLAPVRLEHFKYSHLHQGSDYYLMGTKGYLLAFQIKENGQRVDYMPRPERQ